MPELGRPGLANGVYVASTPWRPLEATIVTAIAILASLVIGVSVTLAIASATSAPLAAGDVVTGTIIGTLVQQFVMVALIVWLAGRKGGRRGDVLALGPPKQGFVAYAGAAVTLVAAVAAMSTAIHLIDPALIKNDLKQFAGILNSPYWWAMYPMVGLGAPLWEELAFRGFLFSALAQSRLGVTGAAIVSSAAWAAIHSYSFVGMTQVFVIGLVFSFILVRTGSLRVPIIIHAIYNTLVTSALLSEAGKGFLAP